MMNTNTRISKHGLQIEAVLYNFVEQEVLPQIPLDSKNFWSGLADIFKRFAEENAALLRERDTLQQKLDAWYQQNPRAHLDLVQHRQFLKAIGYLVDAPSHIQVSTQQVDEEISLQAGAQLVVPLMNARYALNATNARWGSLYDALYGSDIISETDGSEKGATYNPQRGDKVIAFARAELDRLLPLTKGSHAQAIAYQIRDGGLLITLSDSSQTALAQPQSFIAYRGNVENPSALLFERHGNHLQINFDRNTPVGKQDAAGISDIELEAALTTILDLEDSIAAVDAADKVAAYRNWVGILRGDLTETIDKDGRRFTRSLVADREYMRINGETLRLPGRSLLFIRNVGHLMTIDAVCDEHNNPIPEGILDAMLTISIGMIDVLGKGKFKNSRKGSIYIVKPKMHGHQEVALAVKIFAAVETVLQLPNNTVKIGIMDEERRTSLNLSACIAQAQERLVFINTGFLDRTGDEIHSAMRAGAVIRKQDMKPSAWLNAYERNNVLSGLACGLYAHAQIGKGMWAMPDLMAAMLKEKQAQVESGATTAWVPSPTAATIHALHYLRIDARSIQLNTLKNYDSHEHLRLQDELLRLPVVTIPGWSQEEIQQELDNNIQSILGYVVRWVEQGIGCSKVPNIHNVALMEDRATLRISSQHIANWLLHAIVSEAQVSASLQRLAAMVDQQNAHDPDYKPMTPHLHNSNAFAAAKALIFQGCDQPNGYTEPLLHQYRLNVKANDRPK